MHFPFYSENVTARVASLTSSRRLQKYIAIRTGETFNKLRVVEATKSG